MINLAKNQKYVVAFSGGADSALLAYHLKKEGYNVRLVHVKHPDSKASKDCEEIANFCSGWADYYHIPCKIISMSLDSQKVKDFGTEAGERDGRYAILFNELEADEILLTGHHLDDSIETVLFRMIRGSSAKGLSGIRSENSRLIRPLLQMRKKEIQQYVERKSILYRYDNTNDSSELSRGFIRNKVIPLFIEHFHESKFYSSMKRLMENMHECSELLEELYNEDIKACDSGATGITRCIFEKMSDSRQRNFLYFYVSSNTGKFLSKNAILEIQKRLKSNRRTQKFEIAGVTLLLSQHYFLLEK